MSGTDSTDDDDPSANRVADDPSADRVADDPSADRVADDVSADRVVVLDVVGLRPEYVDPDRTPALASLLGDDLAALRPPFPAVTVPAQTTIASGRGPEHHGDVSSGEYDRETDAVEFWDRDRGDRRRLWESASEDADVTTGAFFFQHLIGTTADVAVTPSPIEDEDNNLLEMNCWTNPDGFYDDLEETFGHFPLHRYWGPGASEQSTQWILDAAVESIDRYDLDLCWIYVPHLDYEGLRSGPSSETFLAELETVDELLGEFLESLRSDDRWDETAVAVVSEYGFHDVERAVFPNRALRDAGLLEVQSLEDGGTDVDLDAADAFAMVDHQVTHVYADDGALEATRDALESLEGIDTMLESDDLAAYGIDHPNAGDLVLVAEADAWFQYYWWDDPDEAPPYAGGVDIHEKPGFDPCEALPGDSTMVSQDPSRVGGSHGRVDEQGFGCIGLGGPAVSDGRLESGGGGVIDARAVAPTVAALLGIEDVLEGSFDEESAFDR